MPGCCRTDEVPYYLSGARSPWFLCLNIMDILAFLWKCHVLPSGTSFFCSLLTETFYLSKVQLKDHFLRDAIYDPLLQSKRGSSPGSHSMGLLSLLGIYSNLSDAALQLVVYTCTKLELLEDRALDYFS